MRSYFKTTGTAVIAAAAFLTVVAITSTAKAEISRQEARQAFTAVAQNLRAQCTQDTRRERRSCLRDAARTLRDLMRQAAQLERSCHQGSRYHHHHRRHYDNSACEQAERQFWINEAANIDNSSGDTGGTDTGSTDTGSTDTGSTDPGTVDTTTPM